MTSDICRQEELTGSLRPSPWAPQHESPHGAANLLSACRPDTRRVPLSVLIRTRPDISGKDGLFMRCTELDETRYHES